MYLTCRKALICLQFASNNVAHVIVLYIVPLNQARELRPA